MTGDSLVGQTIGGKQRDLLVVGTVVLPPTDVYRLDVGAVLTPEAHAELEVGEPASSFALKYPDEADVDALEAELVRDYGLSFSIFTQPQVPGSVRHLSEARDIAVALGAFFLAIGVVGLFHALVVSTRRRRGDLAVLRALGFRRAQVRSAVSIEALVLGLAALLVGVPLGLAAGRLVWRSMVEDLGVLAEPQMPWLLVVTVPPALVLLALLASWIPGRSAVLQDPTEQPRSE